MGGLLLQVNLGLKFPFWLKLAAKNEKHQALQNKVSCILTLSHVYACMRARTQRQTALYCSS